MKNLQTINEVKTVINGRISTKDVNETIVCTEPIYSKDNGFQRSQFFIGHDNVTQTPVVLYKSSDTVSEVESFIETPKAIELIKSLEGGDLTEELKLKVAEASASVCIAASQEKLLEDTGVAFPEELKDLINNTARDLMLGKLTVAEAEKQFNDGIDATVPEEVMAEIRKNLKSNMKAEPTITEVIEWGRKQLEEDAIGVFVNNSPTGTSFKLSSSFYLEPSDSIVTEGLSSVPFTVNYIVSEDNDTCPPVRVATVTTGIEDIKEGIQKLVKQHRDRKASLGK